MVQMIITSMNTLTKVIIGIVRSTPTTQTQPNNMGNI
jgi:hypothetical protein